MNIQEILKNHDYANVVRFRVVYPDSIKYIRFKNMGASLKNGKLLSPTDVPGDVLAELIKFNMLEVHSEEIKFWYVFQTPDSSKPVVHPDPITEEHADQLVTLGGYTVLSKTVA